MAGMWMIIGMGLALVVMGLGLAWFFAHAAFQQQQAEARAAWRDIMAWRPPATLRYDPAMVAGLPEIARRYLNHAIALGTPLSRTVELHMEGEFLLGDRSKSQAFAMRAHQLLTAPTDYVWTVELRAGPLRISGSDGLHRAHAWMRMWLFGAVPLVQLAATADLDRSALARPALEAIWAPAALLPAFGAKWVELAPERAQVTLGEGAAQIDLLLTVDATGRLVDIVASRWSDANPHRLFQYQPFGGTVAAEASFDGFTIPSQVHVGNHFGTEDYFAFFNAKILAADYY